MGRWSGRLGRGQSVFAAAVLLAAWPAWAVPAFPGAEGFGAGADRNGDFSRNGYTHIEKYVHSLLPAPLPARASATGKAATQPVE